MHARDSQCEGRNATGVLWIYSVERFTRAYNLRHRPRKGLADTLYVVYTTHLRDFLDSVGDV